MEDLEVVVIGVNRYDFQDQKTGKTITGCNVHYYNKSPQLKDDSFGHLPMKATLAYSEFGRLQNALVLPSKCKAVMSVEMSGKGPSLKVTGFIPLTK